MREKRLTSWELVKGAEFIRKKPTSAKEVMKLTKGMRKRLKPKRRR